MTEVYYKVHRVLQSVTDCFYKVRQVLQNMSAITKGDRLLLQSALRQVLQSVTVIAKWDVTDALYTVQKMKFSIKDFVSKCDKICSFLCFAVLIKMFLKISQIL